MTPTLIDPDLLEEAIDGREKMFTKLRKLTRLVNNENLFGVEANDDTLEELQSVVSDLALAVADRFDLEQELVREALRAGQRAAASSNDRDQS